MPPEEPPSRNTVRQAIQALQGLLNQAKQECDRIQLPHEKYIQECERHDAAAKAPKGDDVTDKEYEAGLEIAMLRKKVLELEYPKKYKYEEAEYDKKVWRTLAPAWSKFCELRDKDWVHSDTSESNPQRPHDEATTARAATPEHTRDVNSAPVPEQPAASHTSEPRPTTAPTQPAGDEEVNLNHANDPPRPAPENEQAGAQEVRPKRGKRKCTDRETVDFADVYQDGRPQTKRRILGQKGNWRILECNRHGMVFNDEDVALSHLRNDHPSSSRTNDHRAMNYMFGVRVRSCNETRATLNNSLFDQEDDTQSRPPQESTLPNDTGRRATSRRRARASAGTSTDRTEPVNSRFSSRSRRRRRYNKMEGIAYPTPGELYMCETESAKEVTIVLPMQMDATYPQMGLPDKLDYLDFAARPAECCSLDHDNNVIRWQEGYHDDQELVNERQFPVVIIDGRFPKERPVVWRSARNLRIFQIDSDDFKGLPSRIRKMSRDLLARREAQSRTARAAANANSPIEIPDSDSSSLLGNTERDNITRPSNTSETQGATTNPPAETRSHSNSHGNLKAREFDRSRPRLPRPSNGYLGSSSTPLQQSRGSRTLSADASRLEHNPRIVSDLGPERDSGPVRTSQTLSVGNNATHARHTSASRPSTSTGRDSTNTGHNLQQNPAPVAVKTVEPEPRLPPGRRTHNRQHAVEGIAGRTTHENERDIEHDIENIPY